MSDHNVAGQGEQWVEETEPAQPKTPEQRLTILEQNLTVQSLILTLLIGELEKAGVLPEGSSNRLERAAVSVLVSHLAHPKSQN